MMDVYLGQILLAAWDIVPKDFLPCDGRLLPIAGNTPLFALLGTTYGGDGKTNFALPDLRGRAPVHASWSNPSDNPYFVGISLGELGGGEEAASTKEPAKSLPVPETIGLNYFIALQGIFPPRF